MTPNTIVTTGPPLSAPPRRSQSATVISTSSTIPDLVDLSNGGNGHGGPLGGLGTSSPFLPRMLIKWSVAHHVQFDRWIATIHTATDPRLQQQPPPSRSNKKIFSSLWSGASGGGGVIGRHAHRRKDIVKSFATAYEAREYALANSPPLMRRRQDWSSCFICESSFGGGGGGGLSSLHSLAGFSASVGPRSNMMLGGASRRGFGFPGVVNGNSNNNTGLAVIHCRNCGVCVCPDCTVEWKASRLPITYHSSPSRRSQQQQQSSSSHGGGGGGGVEAWYRVCLSCDAISSSFLVALEAGNFEEVIALYERGNINLRSMVAPFTVKDRYPVHSAVAGGNLSIVRWLIDVHACPIRHDNDQHEAPLLDAHGHSVLDIAICLRHVDIICYLAKECGLSVKSAGASRNFVLEAFHATLASRHLTWIPGTTNNGPLHRLRSLAQQQQQQQQSDNDNSDNPTAGTTNNNNPPSSNIATTSFMMTIEGGGGGGVGPPPSLPLPATTAADLMVRKPDTADPLVPPTTTLARATSAPAMASSSPMFFNAQGTPLAPVQTPDDANHLMNVIREYQQGVTQTYSKHKVGKGGSGPIKTTTTTASRSRRRFDPDSQPPLPGSTVRMVPTSKKFLMEKKGEDDDDDEDGVEVSSAPGDAAATTDIHGGLMGRGGSLRNDDEYDDDDNDVEFDTSIEYGGIENQNGEDCVLCCEKKRNCVMIPCGHLVTCTDCGSRLMSCPICGKDAKPLTVYKS